MPASEAVLTVVREWIIKADHDLTAAAQILKLGTAAPVETVCFHAEQCIEKYLKAMLVYRSIPFPKSHNIRVLIALGPAAVTPRPEGTDPRSTDRLRDHGAVSESGLDISLSAARKAVALARRIRKEVRKCLPKAALRRQRK